jgi:hypothetical protein
LDAKASPILFTAMRRIEQPEVATASAVTSSRTVRLVIASSGVRMSRVTRLSGMGFGIRRAFAGSGFH